MKTIYVLAFGVLGVLCRFGLNELAARAIRHPFPAMTFLINLFGSFAIGAVYVLGTEKLSLSEPLRAGLMVGLLGGFTTFSAFSLESLLLLESKQFGLAIGYVVGSSLFGIIAAWSGVALTRALT